MTYSYLVTNSGNVTLTSIAVTDPLPGLSAVTCNTTALLPGASTSCTATYSTTQADVDRGSVTNTGTAHGTPPSGPPVSADSVVTVPAVQVPGINLVKTAEPESFSAAGTTITYSYTVTNTGNVTLDPVVVTDPMTGLSGIACPFTPLAPGAEETCTATYVTVQSDVDNGSITNTGTATGTPPTGPVVTAASTETIDAVQQPAIGLGKTASVPSFGAPGVVITYSYLVTNSGNTTLTSIAVIDPMPGLSAVSCPDASLEPGDTETCTATYTTTQADVDRGSITNTGTVTAEGPLGQTRRRAGVRHRARVADPGHHPVEGVQSVELLGCRYDDHVQLSGHEPGQRDARPCRRVRSDAWPLGGELPGVRRRTNPARDVHRDLRHQPGGCGPGQHHQHRHRHRHAADRGGCQRPVELDRAGDPDPGSHDGEVGQPGDGDRAR